MSIYSIPPLICSLLALFLGLIVYEKINKSSINTAFFFLCLTVFWWQFDWFILFNIKNESLASFIIKVGYSGIIFIPPTCYLFVIKFLKLKERLVIRLVYTVGLVFMLFLWFSNYFIDGFYKYSWGFYPKANFLHLVYLCLISFLIIRGLILLKVSLKEQKKQF